MCSNLNYILRVRLWVTVSNNTIKTMYLVSWNEVDFQDDFIAMWACVSNCKQMYYLIKRAGEHKSSIRKNTKKFTILLPYLRRLLLQSAFVQLPRARIWKQNKKRLSTKQTITSNMPVLLTQRYVLYKQKPPPILLSYPISRIKKLSITLKQN